MRARFHLSLRDVGTSITLGEVARLAVILRNDTSSAIAAAMEGWSHPISRDALVMMDLYDYQVAARWADGGKKGPRPKPHPGRPYAFTAEKTRIGDAGALSPDEVRDLLSFPERTPA